MNRHFVFGQLILIGLLIPAEVTSRAQMGAPAAVEPGDVTAHEGEMTHTVRLQLIAEQFDELDRTADQLRRDKSRWPGGEWKLRTFYDALDAPHHSDKDTVDHLDHLRHWMTQRPESITARVALATSLHRWAWVARGNATADKVSEEQWTLFNQRIAEAQAVLQGSRDMRTMCPEWYSAEMTVGLAQGWDGRQMEELFRRAVQFEPDWDYYYTARTRYLLPKWYGKENDATNFAKSAADHLGGDLGDIIYFETTSEILRSNNGNLQRFLKELDWERIQRGYHALAAKYGVTSKEENRLAFMAYQYKDAAVAQQQFALIGADWSEGIWRNRLIYDRARDWSTGHTAWP